MNIQVDECSLTEPEKIELALRKLRPVMSALKEEISRESSTLIQNRIISAFQQFKLSVIQDLRVRIGDDATDAALSMLAE